MRARSIPPSHVSAHLMPEIKPNELLARAGDLLGSSLDYRVTLERLAPLLVPDLADWYAVDVADEATGALERVATFHVDPEKRALAQELMRRYPTEPNPDSGPGRVVRTAAPDHMERIPEELLRAAARDAEHGRLIAALGLASYICVPLPARGRVIGAMTLIYAAESGRTYKPDDLPLAVEIGRRAGIAIDNARLFAAAQREADERRRLEERFRAAVESLGDIVWTNDAAGRMRGEQPGWAAYTGQTPEEYEGYGWADAVHPDDAGPSVDAWNEAVGERRTFVWEHRVRRRDGVWRLFAIRAVPVLGAGGTIREWVGVHTDITEERRREEERRVLLERERVAREEIDKERARVAELARELAAQRDELTRANAGLSEANERMTRSNAELGEASRALEAQQARQAAVMRSLQATSRAAVRLPLLSDADAVLETVMEAVRAGFAPVAAGVWLAEDAGGRRLRRRAGFGLEPDEDAPAPPRGLPDVIDVYLDAYKVGWAARYRRPFVGGDLSGDLQFDQAWLEARRIVAAAVLPLLHQETLLGVLALFTREPLPLETGDTLGTLAALAAVGLHGAIEPGDRSTG